MKTILIRTNRARTHGVIGFLVNLVRGQKQEFEVNTKRALFGNVFSKTLGADHQQGQTATPLEPPAVLTTAPGL